VRVERPVAERSAAVGGATVDEKRPPPCSTTREQFVEQVTHPDRSSHALHVFHV